MFPSQININSNPIHLSRQQLKERNALNETTAEQFSELQRSYDALLQMYGEKVDEVQELQLDLVEAKEIYRAQLDELMQQLRAADLLPGSSSN